MVAPRLASGIEYGSLRAPKAAPYIKNAPPLLSTGILPQLAAKQARQCLIKDENERIFIKSARILSAFSRLRKAELASRNCAPHLVLRGRQWYHRQYDRRARKWCRLRASGSEDAWLAMLSGSRHHFWCWHLLGHPKYTFGLLNDMRWCNLALLSTSYAITR